MARQDQQRYPCFMLAGLLATLFVGGIAAEANLRAERLQTTGLSVEDTLGSPGSRGNRELQVMTCSNGLPGIENSAGTACCDSGCTNPATGLRQCGGRGCGGFGDRSSCCTGRIVDGGADCTATNAAPCFISKTPDSGDDAPPDGALVDDIVEIVEVNGRNPGGEGWADSYSVGGRCYMYTNFDHGVGDIAVDTPTGEMTIREVYDRLEAGPGMEGRPLYNDIQCGNGPANTAADETDCPGLVEFGREGCGQIGPMWDLSELE